MPDERCERVPAGGSASLRDTETTPEEEPVVIGTLFLCTVMLVLIGGAWAMMFHTLAGR